MFDWDEGNRGKNQRHGVADWEIEEALEDEDGFVDRVTIYQGEERMTFLGRARTSGRYLRIVYTERRYAGLRYSRPISAVDMSPTDRRRYRNHRNV